MVEGRTACFGFVSMHGHSGEHFYFSMSLTLILVLGRPRECELLCTHWIFSIALSTSLLTLLVTTSPLWSARCLTDNVLNLCVPVLSVQPLLLLARSRDGGCVLDPSLHSALSAGRKPRLLHPKHRVVHLTMNRTWKGQQVIFCFVKVGGAPRHCIWGLCLQRDSGDAGGAGVSVGGGRGSWVWGGVRLAAVLQKLPFFQSRSGVEASWLPSEPVLPLSQHQNVCACVGGRGTGCTEYL